MKSFKTAIRGLVVLLLLSGGLIFLISNWSWVFSKRVVGEIMEVERVTAPTIISGRATDAQIHSYSVLIKGEDGELYSASSEDRQWQIAKKGYCVEALFFRYPPWQFTQGNTFYNARVEKVKLCPGKTAPPPEVPHAPGETNLQTVPMDVPPVEAPPTPK